MRQVRDEDEAQHGFDADDLGDEEIGDDGGAHDRDDERSRELLVNLLEGKEDAGQWRVKGRRHASCCPARDEKALLSPPTPQRPRDRFARHAAQLHRGALTTKREAREREQASLDELCGDDSRPRCVIATENLGVDLGNPGA